jgi:hypothetical protein
MMVDNNDLSLLGDANFGSVDEITLKPGLGQNFYHKWSHRIGISLAKFENGRCDCWDLRRYLIPTGMRNCVLNVLHG